MIMKNFFLFDIVINFFSLKDWQVKTICLLLSIGLYYYVINEDVEERSLQVPLTVVNKPKNLAISTNIPKYVRVYLKGDKGILSRISRKSIQGEIDLIGAVDQEKQEFSITLEKIDLPEGIKIVSYKPEKITLQFEEIETKELQLIPQVVGNPAEGYEKGRVKVAPEFITVSGPKSQLDKVSNAYLQKISIEGRDASIQRRVRIFLNENLISKSKYATISVPILESKGIRTFNVPIIVEGIVDLDKRLNYRLSQSRITVRARVAANNKDLSEKDFKAWIDISGTAIDSLGNIVPSDVDEQKVSVRLNRKILDTEILGNEPERIHIYYSKKKDKASPVKEGGQKNNTETNTNPSNQPANP